MCKRGLAEAILAAEEESFNDIPQLNEARELLASLEEEHKAMQVQRDEELAKEAAALDAELERDTTTTDAGEDDDTIRPDDVQLDVGVDSDEDEYEQEQDVDAVGVLSSIRSPSRRVNIVKQPSNKYTLLALQQQNKQGSQYILGQHQSHHDDSDLPSIESVSDDDLRSFFEAFARRSSTGTINPLQFSTIWRMLTGDKGNLFQEMKLFHK